MKEKGMKVGYLKQAVNAEQDILTIIKQQVGNDNIELLSFSVETDKEVVIDFGEVGKLMTMKSGNEYVLSCDHKSKGYGISEINQMIFLSACNIIAMNFYYDYKYEGVI